MTRKGKETKQTMSAKATVLSSEWLTTEETMRALGKSRRTVQKLAQRKKLSWKLQSQTGRKPERVYAFADIENLRKEVMDEEERSQAISVRPRSAEAYAVGQQALALTRELIERFFTQREIELKAEQERQIEQRAKAIREARLWLTLEEAAAFSNLPRETLRLLAIEGKINAMKVGGWRIQRRSLEEFAG